MEVAESASECVSGALSTASSRMRARSGPATTVCIQVRTSRPVPLHILHRPAYRRTARLYDAALVPRSAEQGALLCATLALSSYATRRTSRPSSGLDTQRPGCGGRPTAWGGGCGCSPAVRHAVRLASAEGLARNPATGPPNPFSSSSVPQSASAFFPLRVFIPMSLLPFHSASPIFTRASKGIALSLVGVPPAPQSSFCVCCRRRAATLHVLGLSAHSQNATVASLCSILLHCR